MEERACHAPTLSKVNSASQMQSGLQTPGRGKKSTGRALMPRFLRAIQERSPVNCLSPAAEMLLRAAAPQAPGLARPGGCAVPPAVPVTRGASGRSPHTPCPPLHGSRVAGMPAPRSPARVVSVRSWLAAPRGNSLSFRPLRLSTPVTAASSRARSTERLQEPGPGPGPNPGLGPQVAPERFPPDATGPEYSAAATTATKPAAAISQPTTLRPGSAHAPRDPLGGRGKGLADRGQLSRTRWAQQAACPAHKQVFQGNRTDFAELEQPGTLGSLKGHYKNQNPSLTALQLSVVDYIKRQRFLSPVAARNLGT
jgi:hypothetical protein